jgi:hypothetical protein
MNEPAKRNDESPAPSFLGTLVLVFAAIAALFAFDTMMANAEHAEDQAEAQRLFTEGQQLARQGRNSEAVEKYRGALMIRREDRHYRLALARTLMASGKPVDAESAVEEVLSRDSLAVTGIF